MATSDYRRVKPRRRADLIRRFIWLPSVLLMLLCFPRCSRPRCVQEFLWTSNGHASGDWLYSNFRSVEGIQEWQRLRLGLPLGAVTVDRQPAIGAVQIRIEWWAIILNVALPMSAAVLLIRRALRKCPRHVHPDQF